MTQNKQRHGCLTTWLILMIIANTLAAVIYLFASAPIQKQLPGSPEWLFPVMALFSVINLICAVALLKWKKWGFLGFCASSIAVLLFNLSAGLGTGTSLGGLLGAAILYGVLHIGKEDKGWPQLE